MTSIVEILIAEHMQQGLYSVHETSYLLDGYNRHCIISHSKMYYFDEFL